MNFFQKTVKTIREEFFNDTLFLWLLGGGFLCLIVALSSLVIKFPMWLSLILATYLALTFGGALIRYSELLTKKESLKLFPKRIIFFTIGSIFICMAFLLGVFALNIANL